MAQNNANKKQASNNNTKDRKGDTGRTSNQGRKASSEEVPIPKTGETGKEFSLSKLTKCLHSFN